MRQTLFSHFLPVAHNLDAKTVSKKHMFRKRWFETFYFKELSFDKLLQVTSNFSLTQLRWKMENSNIISINVVCMHLSLAHAYTFKKCKLMAMAWLMLLWSLQLHRLCGGFRLNCSWGNLECVLEKIQFASWWRNKQNYGYAAYGGIEKHLKGIIIFQFSVSNKRCTERTLPAVE